MNEAVSLATPSRARRWTNWRERARVISPTRVETALALSTAILLVLSFPDFNLWPLAWVSLVPLLLAVARKPQPGRAFLLGWIAGTLFFLGSCYWLTYAMVRYGGIPVWISYPLLVPGALVMGVFPGLCCLALARMVARWGARALLAAPLMWAALEWARLGLTGQLWNALGYSQAYHPQLIQTAAWGSVYAVSFLIVATNAALAFLMMKRTVRAGLLSLGILLCVAALLLLSNRRDVPIETVDASNAAAVVVALQPDVPMDSVDVAEAEALMSRHLMMSAEALRAWDLKHKTSWGNNIAQASNAQGSQAEVDARAALLPRVVIWPESPMNFSYTNDAGLRETIARFARENRASVLFNSLEPAPARGAYNSAVMVNEEGRMVAQYDKIRLLPFGEYVPLPRWLPGVNLVPVMVGDFTPGANYQLMPLGQARTGVFICFESAFPGIAREFANAGADVLINISNDGYLGPTPVMRQHLANTVFRAVENRRTVLRVTNTGITARITPRGEVREETGGFRTETRTWMVSRAPQAKTFYTRRGDIFALSCTLASLLLFAATFRKAVMSAE